MVIATVFLTIIGMTAGYVLGERHRRSTTTSTSSSTSSPTEQTVVGEGATPAPSIAVDGPACPDPAQQAAAVLGSGNLRQIFMIVTRNRSTVWICEDPRGQLFYQSHTLLDGRDEPLKQNHNGLFLPGVTRTKSGFEVYDQKKNRFEVSRSRLQIYFVDGRVQSDDVDKVEG